MNKGGGGACLAAIWPYFVCAREEVHELCVSLSLIVTFGLLQCSGPQRGSYHVFYTLAVLSYFPSILILLSPLSLLLQNMLPKCSAYLENTLRFHSSFKEAAVGLRTVKCVLVLKRHDMLDVATGGGGGVR